MIMISGGVWVPVPLVLCIGPGLVTGMAAVQDLRWLPADAG
jgi:hypothetical protein